MNIVKTDGGVSDPRADAIEIKMNRVVVQPEAFGKESYLTWPKHGGGPMEKAVRGKV